LEEHSPSTKKRGLFHLASTGLARPEVTRHQSRMLKNYQKPLGTSILLLLPQTKEKPYHNSSLFREITKGLGVDRTVHVCFYAAPYGIVPSEIDDYYPLSQTELALPMDEETSDHVIDRVIEYMLLENYTKILLVSDTTNWDKGLIQKCQRIVGKSGKNVAVITRDGDLSDRLLAQRVLRHLSMRKKRAQA
jgi:predicted RNA-binding protein